MNIFSRDGNIFIPDQADSYPNFTTVQFGFITKLNDKIYYLDIYTFDIEIYEIDGNKSKDLQITLPIHKKDYVMTHLEECLMEDLL